MVVDTFKQGCQLHACFSGTKDSDLIPHCRILGKNFHFCSIFCFILSDWDDSIESGLHDLVSQAEKYDQNLSLASTRWFSGTQTVASLIRATTATTITATTTWKINP